MSWNGSGKNIPIVIVDTGRPRKKHICWLVCGCGVLAIAVTCLIIFCKQTEDIHTPDIGNRVTAIPDVDHSLAAASEDAVKLSEKPEFDAKPTRIGEEANGYVMLADRSLHKVRGTTTNTVVAIKGRYAIFENRSDNEIAGLLCAKPGSIVVGEPNYGKWFTAAFLDSLKTPIIIKSTDDEFTRNLKRELVEAKADLKAAYDRGEDIAKIMSDSRKELKRLMDYQHLVNSEIVNMKRNESASEQDVEDFINAANQLLEEKGIAPIHVGPLTRKRLRLEQTQN